MDIFLILKKKNKKKNKKKHFFCGTPYGGASNQYPQCIIFVNPCPAEPGYALPLQTMQIQIGWLLKPTDLDLHCLPFCI